MAWRPFEATTRDPREEGEEGFGRGTRSARIVDRRPTVSNQFLFPSLPHLGIRRTYRDAPFSNNMPAPRLWHFNLVSLGP